MDEQLLIAGCRKGESWARKALYETYAPTMMSLCLRYVNDKETARDLLQDGFIKVFTKIDTYAGSGAFGGWIHRIFVTTALEYLRKTDALKLSAPVDKYSESIRGVDVSVLDKLSADDLLTCVTRLPTGYRTVFNLYAIEGYSHREIGEMLGISEITSRSQFVRARDALKKSITLLLEQEHVRLQNASKTR